MQLSYLSSKQQGHLNRERDEGNSLRSDPQPQGQDEIGNAEDSQRG